MIIFKCSRVLKFSTLVIPLLDFMNCWCHAGLDWMEDELNVFQSLVFYYLQTRKFIPTISDFFTKNRILFVESYNYGVLLANTDFITYQSEYYNLFNISDSCLIFDTLVELKF
jgi:hypothetical protein